MHQALYRKWRPATFDEVVGQEHITSVLRYEIEHNAHSHAYLFCGSRGTGKTTCAKILAKAVNCESPINGSPCNRCASCMSIDSGAATDVLEMDAASNNGVDNIRDIRDEVVYSPSALKYRVYIVDEVHMLSGSAFNALLKTLEEPPSHVVFILATTELHKLPSTIISRCQRFDFRRISTEDLMARLRLIAGEESIEYEDEALRLIAKHAQGGMRDAISLLELCAGSRRKLTPDIVTDTIGSGGRANIESTVHAISNCDYDAIFSTVDGVVSSSKDISVFWQELLSYYRDMLVMKTTETAEKYLDLTETEGAALKKASELFSKEALLAHCRIIDDAHYAMQRAGAIKRIIAEMALVKLCDSSIDVSPESLLLRISKLENALAGGAAVTMNQPNVSEKNVDEAKKEEPKKEITPDETPKKPQANLFGSEELKAYRGWNEIAERVGASDVSVAPFLKQARAFISGDGKVVLRFGSDFAMSMASGDAIKKGICAAFGAVFGKEFGLQDIVYEKVKGNEDTISDMDELMI